MNVQHHIVLKEAIDRTDDAAIGVFAVVTGFANEWVMSGFLGYWDVQQLVRARRLAIIHSLE